MRKIRALWWVSSSAPLILTCHSTELRVFAHNQLEKQRLELYTRYKSTLDYAQIHTVKRAARRPRSNTNADGRTDGKAKRGEAVLLTGHLAHYGGKMSEENRKAVLRFIALEG